MLLVSFMYVRDVLAGCNLLGFWVNLFYNFSDFCDESNNNCISVIGIFWLNKFFVKFLWYIQSENLYA